MTIANIIELLTTAACVVSMVVTLTRAHRETSAAESERTGEYTALRTDVGHIAKAVERVETRIYKIEENSHEIGVLSYRADSHDVTLKEHDGRISRLEGEARK